MVTLGLVCLVGVAAPAGAQTGTPDVVPIVACSFRDPATGAYNTVWSYKNQTKAPKQDVTIPVGATNRFDNPGQNAGQPTVFKPGTNQNVFVVTHRGSSTWMLTARSATAPGAACKSNPVPIVAAGWSPLVTLGLVTLALGAIVFWRARRAARPPRA